MEGINTKELEQKSKWVRRKILEMLTPKGHWGGSLSCVEILVALYYKIMRPEDVFILSKGHACPPLYAILADKGYFPLEWLKEFGKDGTRLGGHPDKSISGVVINSGSLGHGLGIGCGMALANRFRRVFVLLGDGECMEGSVWEGAMFASRHKLSNLIVIVDYNKQSAYDYTYLEPFAEKWEAFGWSYTKGNGHSFNFLCMALNHWRDKPRVIVADTIKGKGISFMEGKLGWHSGVLEDENLEQARREI